MPARRAAPPGARPAALVALLHAGLWLLAAAGLGRTIGGDSPPLLAALIALFNGAQAYLYWQLAAWLPAVHGYRGADRYLRLCAGLLLVDLVARCVSVLSGAGGFAIVTLQPMGVFGVTISYPHLQYFAFGTVLIALGYSLLRIPGEPHLLRIYGVASIATGMAYAAFLGHLAVLPGIGADLILARLFSAAGRPAALRRRRGFTIAPQV